MAPPGEALARGDIGVAEDSPARSRVRCEMDMQGLDRASQYLEQVLQGRWNGAVPEDDPLALEASA